jgi:putative two-component system response regulator
MVNTSLYKILVVDDALENLKIVSGILQNAGYEFDTATSGIDALRLTTQRNYDIILTDISMPDMGGIELCRFLKADLKTHNIPVIFLTANESEEVLERAFRVGGVDYIKKPLFKSELLMRIATHLKIKDYEKSLERKVLQKTKEIYKTQIQLTYTLGGIAEGHSIETHLHVKRVAQFCYRLGRLYGLSKEDANLLKDASSLHDIGKLGIDNKILHKESALSNKEFEQVKKHTIIGANMLNNIDLPLFKVAKTVCLQHHEKYDGTGYPKGLEGDSIHIYARIVAIADVFDALLHARSYKKQWSVEDVLLYIKEMREKHFDPQLVDLLFENMQQFLEIYKIEVSEENMQKSLTKKIKKDNQIEKLFGWFLHKR